MLSIILPYIINPILIGAIALETLLFRDDTLSETYLHLNRLVWLMIRMIFYVGVFAYSHTIIRSYPKMMGMCFDLIGPITFFTLVFLALPNMVFLALAVLLEATSGLPKGNLKELMVRARTIVDLTRRLLSAAILGFLALFFCVSLVFLVLNITGISPAPKGRALI